MNTTESKDSHGDEPAAKDGGRNKQKFVILLKQYLADKKSTIFYDQIFSQLPFDFFSAYT